MTTTSSIIYDFVRSLSVGEEFTAYQLYQLTECDGTTHPAVCGILHRLVRAGMLTITRKDKTETKRPCYVFMMVDPNVTISVIETKRCGHAPTRNDTERHPLFTE